jgi:hypothetical protein
MRGGDTIAHIRLVQVRFGSVFEPFEPNPEPNLEFGSAKFPNLNRTFGSVQAVQVRFGRTPALFGKRSGNFTVFSNAEPKSVHGSGERPNVELNFGSVRSVRGSNRVRKPNLDKSSTHSSWYPGLFERTFILTSKRSTSSAKMVIACSLGSLYIAFCRKNDLHIDSVSPCS